MEIRPYLYLYFYMYFNYIKNLFWSGAASTGRACFCQLSIPSVQQQQQQQQRSKQVRGCQSNCRLQQEETGLNRCEQLPQPLGSHYVFPVRRRIYDCYHYRPALNATLQCLLHTQMKCFTKPSLLIDEVTPRLCVRLRKLRLMCLEKPMIGAGSATIKMNDSRTHRQTTVEHNRI